MSRHPVSSDAGMSHHQLGLECSRGGRELEQVRPQSYVDREA